MRTLILTLTALFTSLSLVFAQTECKPTNEFFRNGERVYDVYYHGQEVGEFWPVHGINLVTSQTNPELFHPSIDMKTLHKILGGVATAPDGMTSASTGLVEGICLANGVECGDGEYKNYGIVIVENGFKITFTHKKELGDNFNQVYDYHKQRGNTIFFLPSIQRTDPQDSLHQFHSSTPVDRLLVRRETPNGTQIGFVVLNRLITYTQSMDLMKGLDRYYKDGSRAAWTTHIYYADGANKYGQCAKEVNDTVVPVGQRQAGVNSNYLVLY